MTNLQIKNEIIGLIRRAESYKIQILTMTSNEDSNIRTELNLDIFIDGEYHSSFTSKVIEESEIDFEIKMEKHIKKLNKDKEKLMKYFTNFDNVVDAGNNNL